MARRRTSVLKPARMASSGEPGTGRVSSTVCSQRRISVSDMPPSASTVKVPLRACSGPSLVDEAGRHRDHAALPHPVGEQLAVLDQLAHRRQRQAEPLRDVGDGQPGAHEGLEVVHGLGSGVLGCVAHGAQGATAGAAVAGASAGCRVADRSPADAVPAGRVRQGHRVLGGHSRSSAGRDNVAPIASHSGTVCPNRHYNHIRHSCHRLVPSQGHAMVISAPPATVPPAALLPAAHVAASNPAPHGWTTYRVRPGDTLIGIAARFRTTVGTLAARNHVRNPRAASSPAPCSACRAPRRPRRRRPPGRRLPGLRRAQRRHAQRHRAALPRAARRRCSRPTTSRPARSSSPASGSSCAAPPRKAAAPHRTGHHHGLPGAGRRHARLDRRCATTRRSPPSPGPARSPAAP